jgi:hypothetical protein
MGIYQKNPLQIRAVRWSGQESDFNKLPDWAIDDCLLGSEPVDDGQYTLAIQTPEGTLTVSPGDFIIQGVQGEVYPCDPQVFAQTYEYVGEDEEET